jgi:hypothetical protein
LKPYKNSFWDLNNGGKKKINLPKIVATKVAPLVACTSLGPKSGYIIWQPSVILSYQINYVAGTFTETPIAEMSVF